MRSLVALLAWGASHLTPLHLGRGTVFSHPSVDRHNPPGRMACERRVMARGGLARRLYDRGLLIAHPTLPCASLVSVCSVPAMSCALAVVGDRGPRRALVDLFAPLARALGHVDGLVLLMWATEANNS